MTFAALPSPSSRELLDLTPGSRITALGRAWVLIGIPWCAASGKPGIHRARMHCLPLEGDIGAAVEALGWRKAAELHRLPPPKCIHGNDIAAILSIYVIR